MEQPDRPRRSPADVVFGVGDFLDEILLRLDIPRFLVAALQVNEFWRSRAASPTFRSLFRKRVECRPRPLGFYLGLVDYYPHNSTKFVPMSQRPELAGVFDRANFGSFGDDPYPGGSAHALDCRNGRVLMNQLRYRDGPYVVLSPLEEAPVMAHLPPIEPPLAEDMVVLRFLPGGDQPSCLFVGISPLPHKQEALVRLCVLQDGTWVDRTSFATGLSAPLGLWLDHLLVHDKLYLLFSSGYIVRLDLASMRFFVIQLPDGVEPVTKDNEDVRTQVLSRADDSGVYFIKVSGTQLYVWLCKTGDGNAVTWVLEDSFSLYEAFGQFANRIWKEEDKTYSYDVVHLFGAGDNAEFVFLVDIDGCNYDHIFYLNIRTRKVEEAYARGPNDGEVLDICPFMMV